jgi:GxxExxY protein
MTELIHKELSFKIIGAAMEVHKILGAGFLEAVYQAALEREFTLRNIQFDRQVGLPVAYKGELISEYKADIIVDKKIIIEIKAVYRLNSMHEAQAIHYLTATGMQLAILINFSAGSLDYRRVVKTK